MPARHSGPGIRQPQTDARRNADVHLVLHEQIDIIRPKVLVGLGATAIEGLLGKTAGIMRLRGQWHTYRDIPLMPTYHPAFLLRNQAVSEKRKVWEDLLLGHGKAQPSHYRKQRAYFLKG